MVAITTLAKITGWLHYLAVGMSHLETTSWQNRGCGLLFYVNIEIEEGEPTHSPLAGAHTH